MSESESHDEFEVTIPSDPGAGHDVQQRILRLVEKHEYPPRAIFGMTLALEEAIVNAIKHGNNLDPAKSVYVHCRVDTERALVIVEDEGPGFDVSHVPDPTDEANLEKPSGRGIMLMRSFMTRVDYNETGNRVELELLREEAESES